MEAAYGAGRAGGSFDPVAYIKKPQVIVRLISLLFSMIVFGCIVSKGYAGHNHRCQFANPSACSYGVGIGIIAFIICIAFLVLDALFDQISGVQHRKYAVLADLAVSGLWCFLWFVGFCFLTDSWRKTTQVQPDNYGKHDIQASIAFSFFSFGSWAAQVVLAVLRYRKGVTEEFGGSSETPRPDIAESSNPYASFGGEPDQSYQHPPFSGATDEPQAPTSNYQPPTY